MFLLKRLILIDAYKPGAIQEIRLDGHSNLNGVSGAGNTTLLGLIPYCTKPGHSEPHHHLKTDSSPPGYCR